MQLTVKGQESWGRLVATHAAKRMAQPLTHQSEIEALFLSLTLTLALSLSISLSLHIRSHSLLSVSDCLSVYLSLFSLYLSLTLFLLLLHCINLSLVTLFLSILSSHLSTLLFPLSLSHSMSRSHLQNHRLLFLSLLLTLFRVYLSPLSLSISHTLCLSLSVYFFPYMLRLKLSVWFGIEFDSTWHLYYEDVLFVLGWIRFGLSFLYFTHFLQSLEKKSNFNEKHKLNLCYVLSHCFAFIVLLLSWKQQKM